MLNRVDELLAMLESLIAGRDAQEYVHVDKGVASEFRARALPLVAELVGRDDDRYRRRARAAFSCLMRREPEAFFGRFELTFKTFGCRPES